MTTPSDYGLDVLCFSPHPDDAEIWCGGFLLQMSRSGYSVGVADMTFGELATGGNHQTREQEIANATEILGLAYRGNLRLPDGNISPYDETQLNAVVELLRDKRPELVLIPHYHTRHPDHGATSELLSRAVFFAGVKNYQPTLGGGKFTPKQVLHYQMRYEFRPSFVVDVSDVHEQKIKAIGCYASQLHRPDMKPEDETLIGSPLAVRAIAARDSYYGAMVGVSHGEPFLVSNMLALKDPLKHFRENPNTGALIFPTKEPTKE